jgi:enoyl-CoA hydratase/carnithine racemase
VKTININYEDSIAILTIDNPPVNSITPQVIDDLEEAFLELGEKENLRAVVLASVLEKVFVAGADINQFVTWKKQDGIDVTTRGHHVLKMIEDFDKPVVCAINGIAFGGGLELALACDIRVMDERAKVGLPETGLGIIPGYGGTQRLPRLVGPGMAKLMIYTGKPITAKQAGEIGLAEIVTETGKCLENAKSIAEQIATQAPIAISTAKKAVAVAMEYGLEQGIDFEIQSVGYLAGTDDKTEGAQAFLEKRPAIFNNR